MYDVYPPPRRGSSLPALLAVVAALAALAVANPGNSGGPALDERGRIVGVLVSGGAQNVNFAVPIARACERLRDC